MATHPRRNRVPMTGDQRAGFFLTPDECAAMPDIGLSVLLSVIQEAIYIAKDANKIGAWYDLVKLEAVVGDEMRRRQEVWQAERIAQWDAECADVEVGPSVIVTLREIIRNAVTPSDIDETYEAFMADDPESYRIGGV